MYFFLFIYLFFDKDIIFLAVYRVCRDFFLLFIVESQLLILILNGANV